VTLIGVKSKYGSGWGTSPGLININDTPNKKKVCARSLTNYIEYGSNPYTGSGKSYTNFFYKNCTYNFIE